jgi:hypothetical protein
MASVLHVLNGDATRHKLEQAGVPGDMTVWADVLHDGPVPGSVSAEEFRRVRARHLQSYGYVDTGEEIAGRLQQWDAALDDCGRYGEVVFWFEHDLFDQLILIRHLHWLAEWDGQGNATFSLICIGEFPGVGNFTGLGALEPQQLASLITQRQPITRAQIDLGRRAWQVFTGSDPIAIDEFRRGDTGALPFLQGALRRQLEDFPGTQDGLARSERQIVRALDEGQRTVRDLFRATQRMEERVFMGDATFWAIASRLAGGSQPLIDIPPRDDGAVLPGGPARLTDAGRQVLGGRADHLELNGIDRWMGGVHLTDGRYRWDGRRLLARH